MQSDVFLENGKQAEKIALSRPRTLARVKISEVPEFRNFGKYRGFLGPNQTPSRKNRTSSPSLEQVFQKMQKENRSVFSQGSQFRTPLFLDLESLAVQTASNEENLSPFGSFVPVGGSDYQIRVQNPSAVLRKTSSVALSRLQHEDQFQDVIQTFNSRQRPVREISTRELSTYRRDLNLLTNSKEIQQQLEL